MLGGVKNTSQPKAHQAQWNVQVVRGKVTTRCLWNACKALSIGLLLLSIGTTMAVIGYYADQLSIRSETRGNSTVKIKNESRGFHLNNLSYAGPIVMGIGGNESKMRSKSGRNRRQKIIAFFCAGFIVVAACVMTFEARDSAAKVVPARFKPNLNTSIAGESAKTTPRNSKTFQKLESKRSTSVQTPTGGKCPGIYKLDSSGMEYDWSPKHDIIGRKAFTAAFVQFSRELLENSTLESSRRWRQKMSEASLNKSPSAPDLAVENSGLESPKQDSESNLNRRLGKGSPKTASRSQREFACPLETIPGNLLFRPGHLQRQALSMDNPFYESYDCCIPSSTRTLRQQNRRSGGSKESFEIELGSSAGVSGSQTSMALDLHDCQVTLKVKDESANKRSDTARRHQLLRQKPVEDDVIPKCSCIPRFLCTPMVEEYNISTKSSTNLKSPCHHCLRSTSSCSGRIHISKITADVRSRSFSHTCSQSDSNSCTLHEDNRAIFCKDRLRKTNLSSENIRLNCCENKHRCARKNSSSISPYRIPRSECQTQAFEGSECLAHGTKDFSGVPPTVRSHVKKRQGNPKMEGSLSAEEQNYRRIRSKHFRSSSFSPTRKISRTPTPSRDGSSPPGKQSCFLASGVLKDTKDGEMSNEKIELEEPS